MLACSLLAIPANLLPHVIPALHANADVMSGYGAAVLLGSAVLAYFLALRKLPKSPWRRYSVFFAVFMGKWINRSKVMTAAEWMKTRFGEDAAGLSARSAYAILAIVTVTGFLAYDAVDRLTAAGRTARRLHEGMLEWRLAGLPVDDGVA